MRRRRTVPPHVRTRRDLDTDTVHEVPARDACSAVPWDREAVLVDVQDPSWEDGDPIARHADPVCRVRRP